ncbi:hypothetical protein ACLB2K_050633 [Fragaria x ananassa]
MPWLSLFMDNIFNTHDDFSCRMALEMQKDLSRTVSNAGTSATRRSSKRRTYQSEASVSSITAGFLVQERKRLGHWSSNQLSANTNYKGVVQQPNGRWGAQIYATHNRVWLGTFDSDIKAAMAYDSAAIKLHNGERQRNFAWTNTIIQERHFQNLYSQETVLNMIKDGSYQARFVEFLMACQAAEVMSGSNSARVQQSMRDIFPKQLFQKELTPCDVGKLNRLVIPKNYATKFFPRIDESMQEGLDENNPAPDVQLSFYDENMRGPWKFRYCYWKSSQSFVFTRGWNRFVKNSKLKANDTIRFYECHIEEGDNKDPKSFYMIKIDRAEDSNNVNIVENASQSVSPALTFLHAKKLGEEKDDISTQTAEVIDEIPQVSGANKTVKLFGVVIS